MINPNWNEGIAKLLPRDYRAADTIYNELTNRWPQINPRTSVRLTGYYRIDVADPSYILPMITRWKHVAVSGWRRLQATASYYSLKQLDDPDVRAKYHAALLGAMVRLPRYAFWRLAGRLFKRADWTRKGMEKVADNDCLQVAVPRPPTRTIELEPFSMYWMDFRETRHFYLVCGYDPLNDTFFVQR